MITRRVLIADSDPHMHLFVKQALTGFDLALANQLPVRFKVDWAATDADAIQQIRVAQPHILVTEHWTPRLDGVKILESLRTDRETTANVSHKRISHAPVQRDDSTVAIVAATCPSIPAAVQATKLGAFDFLAKPLSTQQLRDVLTKATSHQMGCEGVAVWSSAQQRHSPVQVLSRIPAALAQLASTAVSLHW